MRGDGGRGRSRGGRPRGNRGRGRGGRGPDSVDWTSSTPSTPAAGQHSRSGAGASGAVGYATSPGRKHDFERNLSPDARRARKSGRQATVHARKDEEASIRARVLPALLAQLSFTEEDRECIENNFETDPAAAMAMWASTSQLMDQVPGCGGLSRVLGSTPLIHFFSPGGSEQNEIAQAFLLSTNPTAPLRTCACGIREADSVHCHYAQFSIDDPAPASGLHGRSGR